MNKYEFTLLHIIEQAPNVSGTIIINQTPIPYSENWERNFKTPRIRHELTVNNEHQLESQEPAQHADLCDPAPATDSGNQLLRNLRGARSSSTHALALLFPKSGMSSPPFSSENAC